MPRLNGIHHNIRALHALPQGGLGSNESRTGQRIGIENFEAVEVVFTVNFISLNQGGYVVGDLLHSDTYDGDYEVAPPEDVMGSIVFVPPIGRETARMGYIGSKKFLRARATHTGGFATLNHIGGIFMLVNL